MEGSTDEEKLGKKNKAWLSDAGSWCEAHDD